MLQPICGALPHSCRTGSAACPLAKELQLDRVPRRDLAVVLQRRKTVGRALSQQLLRVFLLGTLHVARFGKVLVRIRQRRTEPR
jgi:hypothetical protein